MSRAILPLGALLLGGCGGADPSTFAYILLDRDARTSGVRLGVGDVDEGAAPVLPAAVDVLAGESRQLLVGRARVPVQPQPGELVWVHGRRAAREVLHLGSDVELDVLQLAAATSAARALATLLDADLTDGGDGTFTLIGADLWANAADLDPPERILEASPQRAILDPIAPGGLGPLAALAPDEVHGRALASFVGFYRGEHASLLVDAAGAVTLFGDACAGPTRRGRFALDTSDGAIALDGSARLHVVLEDGTSLTLSKHGDGLASPDLGALALAGEEELQ